jgi:polysaccharide biosynthesis transport protein
MFHQTHVIKSATIELPDTIRPAGPLQGALLDLGKLWLAVRNHKRLIAATVLISLLAATVFMLVATPQYTAVTQILIDPSDLRAVENGLTSNNQLSDVAVILVESQVRVLTSDNVLRRVIASERLDTDPKFGKGPTSPLRTLVEAVIKPFGISRALGKIDPTLTALYELQQRIRVKRAERTYVVDVSVTTEDGEKSVRIANALTQAYLAEQAAARSEAARRVSESLSARLSELKNRVRMAEERVEEFKSRNNIVGASGLLVNEQQLSDLNNQLSLARGRTAEAKSRFEQLQNLQRSGADVGAFTEAVQSQTMAALRSQYADVMRREAEQTTSLGERHPTVIEVRAQGQRLRRVIAEEINRIAEAARSDYERARASEESLARSLEALKRNTMTTNEARVGLREIERDVQASRAVYESFLVRSRETGVQEWLDTKNVRVISKADVPLRRSWPPSYALIAFGAVMLGLSAGTGLAFLRELSDDRDSSPHAPPRETPSDLPLLAVLPNIGVGHPLSSFEDPKSRPAAEIRKLHDSLRAGRKKWAGQSILLVAPHDGAEATAVAFNLALVAAANHSVLLIDADSRRQALAAVLPHQSQAGLIDVASGQKLLSEVVTRDPQTNIHVLPLFAQRIGSYRDVKNEDIKSAFDQTKRFDLVIVLGTLHDGNPIGTFFAGLVDQVVLIIKEGATRKRDIDGVLAILGSEARKIRGTVLTNVKA